MKKEKSKVPKAKSNIKKSVISPIEVQKTLQYAKDEMLIIEELEDVTPILEFIEMFQKAADPRASLPSKLISIKIPEPLLAAFKYRAELEGVPYQTLIKKLMMDYLGRMGAQS